MKTIDLCDLNLKIKKFSEDRDWDQFHSVKNLAMALNVECSELLEIFQWMKEEESNNIKASEIMSKIEDEVADIFIYLMRIMDKTGIDLEQVIIHKMKKNADKYPIDLSKGNAKKYTEF